MTMKPLPQYLIDELVDQSRIPSAWSSERVEWQCSECGWVWESAVGNRSKGRGCPQCAKHKISEALRKRAYEANPLSQHLREQLVTDGEYSANSKQRVEWKCIKCNHRWVTTPQSRTQGRGCQKCDYASRGEKKRARALRDNPLTPQLISEMVFPAEVSAGSSTEKHLWRCTKGHEYLMTPKDRSRGHGCPKCAAGQQRSRGEEELFDYVSSLGYECISNDREVIKPLELDIYIPALSAGIEYNGSYWHSTPRAQQRDSRKLALCKESGIRLLTIWDYEWKESGCKEYIYRWIQSLTLLAQE